MGLDPAQTHWQLTTTFKPFHQHFEDAESRLFGYYNIADGKQSRHCHLVDVKHSCHCSALTDFALVGMGDANELDKRVFASLDLVLNYGGEKWWLYVSRCSVCLQYWMIAQEERIHDNFFFKRIDPETFLAIVETSDWPSDFMQYEELLRLARDAGHVTIYLDPRSIALVETVNELRTARPDISPDEVAFLLSISTKQALKLLQG